MQLSVIILNYNVRYFLEQCLFSVQRALEGIDSEIIVVDNASSDDSCDMVKTKFPHVKLIKNSANLGFPKGNNIGVAEAKGDYICILNPDTVVAEDTFVKILNSQLSILNSQLGIIGCKLIDGSGKFLPESKRGVPTPWVAFTKLFGLYKISNAFGDYYAQHLAENESGKVAILVGAFMWMPRILYLEVGGFDEDCFMYSDDIDLSYTIEKSGKSNYYFHETSIIHYKGESTVRDGTYRRRFQEAMQFFYKKHFKKSWFFDGMMYVGSFVFSLLKKHEQKDEVRTIDEYVVFTKGQLQINLSQKTLYYSSLNQFESEPSKNREIIFDTATFSFAEIITFMEQNKDKNLSFKNYIVSSNYVIGSNHSTDKGQIIML
ncbi:glycosyltransferase family 2 protein [Flavobacterium sp.]|jgi:GT2 family glycosyltransferase|uniref:glycosyltransferase family 2 protein n=1 Tax=Flavobacterium sp. TaxID=239 RepID=UPI0037BEFDA5